MVPISFDEQNVRKDHPRCGLGLGKGPQTGDIVALALEGVGEKVATTLIFVGDDDARYSYPSLRKSRDMADLNLSPVKEAGVVFLRYASTSTVSADNLVGRRRLPCHDSTIEIVEALACVTRFYEFNRCELRTHAALAINHHVGILWN